MSAGLSSSRPLTIIKPSTPTLSTNVGLFAVPGDVLSQICNAVLAQQTASASTLLTLSSSWHAAAARVLYRSLTLQDDDSLLLNASEAKVEPCKVDMAGTSLTAHMLKLADKLRAIHKNDIYSECVKVLMILPGKPAWRESAQLDERVSPSSSMFSVSALSSSELAFAPPDPLDDIALHHFVRTRLPNLNSFTWSAARPPPDLVVEAFSQSLHLRHFSAWSAISKAYPPVPIPHRNPFKDASQTSGTDSNANFRWDGHGLALLPSDLLTGLNLANLSSEGIRMLCSTLPLLTGLEKLVLENILCLDDALFAGLAEYCVRLRILSIREMAGTKLTNKGMAALMERSRSLEEVDLVNFEGA